MRSRVTRSATVLTATLLLLSGCTGGHDEDGDAATTFRTPSRAVDLVAGRSPAENAVGTSRRLFERSDVAIVSARSARSQQRSVKAAARLGVPVLLVGPTTRAELDRLGVRTTLAVGPKDADWPDLPGRRLVGDGQDDVDRAVGRLPRTSPRDHDVVVLVHTPGADLASVGTARAAGATVVGVKGGDPRADRRAIRALRDAPDAPVVGVGSTFRRGLGYEVTAVRRDLTQPGGGLLVFPGRHVVALYGHPGTPSLGLLGEQGTAATVRRAARLAREYQELSDQPVVPALEIIATVASSEAGDDGDYSAESSVRDLTPLVNAAEKAGQYVVIDLQPGRTDFLTQAKRYRSLLERPHVGLALDPEWRLARDQKHLTQIGSVGASEVNAVADWLADLTRERRLPQKLFVLHQFSTSMIRDRSTLDVGHPELSTVVHVDGQGTPGAKIGTWNTIRQGSPKGVDWGWKNFLDEDEPMLTVPQTWRDVRPRPDLVTYQ